MSCTADQAISKRPLNKRLAIPLCFTAIIAISVLCPRDAAFAAMACSYHLYEFLAGFIIAFVFTNQTCNQVLARYRTLTFMLVATVAIASIVLLQKHMFKLTLASTIVFFALLINPHSSVIRRLVILGNESYSTYLVHAIPIGLFLHFFGSDLGRVELWMTIAGISVAVWLTSSLSYRYIERSRVLAALRMRLDLLLGGQRTAAVAPATQG
jgi:peptidoglycan/LPS O-acetylase OafA/YrhL